MSEKAKEKEKVSDTTPSIDEFLSPFTNIVLWTSLYHGKAPPFVDTEGFGYGQPVVRRSAWSLLQVLVQKFKGSLLVHLWSTLTHRTPLQLIWKLFSPRSAQLF